MRTLVHTLGESMTRTLADSHRLFFSVAAIWALIYLALRPY
jgi:hypothetical protein